MPHSPLGYLLLNAYPGWWDFHNDPTNSAELKKMAEPFAHMIGEQADEIVSEYKCDNYYKTEYENDPPPWISLRAWCRNGLKWTSIKLYRERYGRSGRRPGTPKGAGAFPPVDPSDPRITPDTELERQQLHEKLERAFAQLSPVQRRIIEGRYFSVPKATYKQLSDELQISEYQVKQEEKEALKTIEAEMRPFV
jgi:RNA polymerase sigma factor (sigma-70 family)